MWSELSSASIRGPHITRLHRALGGPKLLAKKVQALALNKLSGLLLSGSKQGSGGAQVPASLLHEFTRAVSTWHIQGQRPRPLSCVSPPRFSPFSLTAGGISAGVQLHHVVTWQIEGFSCYLINAKETHEASKL